MSGPGLEGPRPGQGWVKTCPAATRCRAAASASSPLVVHRAEMLNAREPGREARTTWTAVASHAVFTVTNPRHRPTLRPLLSAQIRLRKLENQQVSVTRHARTLDREPTRVWRATRISRCGSAQLLLACWRLAGGCRGTSRPDNPCGRRRVSYEQMGRTDGTPDELAAAVRADAVQDVLGAVAAPGALVRADQHVRGRRVEVPVAAFAIRPQLQHVPSIGRQRRSWQASRSDGDRRRGDLARRTHVIPQQGSSHCPMRCGRFWR